MYWLTAAFIFRRVVSPFHRLDPRVRLLISIELFVLALLGSYIIEEAALVAAILSVAVAARSLRRIARTMVFSAGFALFILVINLVFGLGVEVAVLYSVRFIAIISSTTVFFVTTSPDELEQVMKWFRVPRDVVFAFITAVRFIPVVMLDAFQIMDAQKSRGLEFEKGNILRRVRNLVPLMVPLVVNSVIRSGQLAEAMESRAYGTVKHPTSLYGLAMRWYDWAVVGCSLLLAAGVLYIYHYVSFPF